MVGEQRALKPLLRASSELILQATCFIMVLAVVDVFQ